MCVVPCKQNKRLSQQIEEFAEVLKTKAHRLGDHGLSESDFYRSGLFRGAIERVRGQFSATMGLKREFVAHILNYMADSGHIVDWESSGEKNRHDYTITMQDGYLSVIELKGCLDGNNTNIFDRPPHAREFIIWSVCTNPSASPRHNVWSGIHTRLSAEIIERGTLVDGLVVWDWLCGTAGRPCPKTDLQRRSVEVGPYHLVPPCLYLFPSTVPSVRTNPHPTPHTLASVRFMRALHDCFNGDAGEINYVSFSVGYAGVDLVRTTKVKRGGTVQKESKPCPIRRR